MRKKEKTSSTGSKIGYALTGYSKVANHGIEYLTDVHFKGLKAKDVRPIS